MLGPAVNQMSPGWEKYWPFVISQTEGRGHVPAWREEGGGSGRDAHELSLTQGLFMGVVGTIAMDPCNQAGP